MAVETTKLHCRKTTLQKMFDEIKANVEHMKKLAEEEKQRAKTNAEYKQYLKLKEKFEKEEEKQQ